MNDQTKRIIGAIKRVNLAPYDENWSDNCHVNVTTVKYKEMVELKKLDTEELDEAGQIEFVQQFIKRHFVSGRIMLYDTTSNQLVEADATEADMDELPIDMSNAIFEQVMGQKLDPKGTSPSTNTESTTSSETPTPSGVTVERQVNSDASTVTP